MDLLVNHDDIALAARWIAQSKYAIAFTGAGISLESGVPTFRDSDGLWSKYDVADLELSNFLSNPKKCWNTIKACFYYFMADKDIRPNFAHESLARMEKSGLLKDVVTQNIDNLHQMAGSKRVWEFHGTTATASCVKCHHQIPASQIDFDQDVPSCPKCGALLKPDFVFFGEGIPQATYEASTKAANKADVCIVVGSTAVVMPAGMIPIIVKRNGGKVIEINPAKSNITDEFSDIHLQMGAVDAFKALEAELLKILGKEQLV